MSKVANAIFAGIVGTVFVAGCTSTRTQESAGEYSDDAAITAKVKTALLNEPNVKSTEISVQTYRGVVQLSGFVDSEAMAQRAVQRAKDVSGVRSVKNDMQIRSPARS